MKTCSITRASLPVLGVVTLTLIGCDAAVDDSGLEAVSAPDNDSTLPLWPGIWIPEGKKANISALRTDLELEEALNLYSMATPNGPWTEEGMARFNSMVSDLSQGKSEGWGFPMMLDGFAPFEIVIAPNQTVIINTYHEVIQIFTDGREHPPARDLWPTTWGNSVGYWEGDTLYVDTIAVRDPTDFMFWAPPFSDDAHYQWSLTRINEDQIRMTMTIEDPLTLSEPWTVNVRYNRTPSMDRLIYDAFVNDRSELAGEAFTIIIEN